MKKRSKEITNLCFVVYDSNDNQYFLDSFDELVAYINYKFIDMLSHKIKKNISRGYANFNVDGHRVLVVIHNKDLLND